MNKLYGLLRVILGLFIIVSGAMLVFLGKSPMQFPSEPAANFMNALANSGYLMRLVGILQVACGISFVSNRFVPLAAVVFFPISVNMLLFHVFLDIPSGIPSLIILALNSFILLSNIDSYRPVLKAR